MASEHREYTQDFSLVNERLSREAAHALRSNPGWPRDPLGKWLQQYDWPGNVRELQHVIERAVITSTKGRLNIELPSTPKTSKTIETNVPTSEVRTDAEIRQMEADNIRAALTVAKGKVSGPNGAASLLGIKPTTLASRIKALGITLPMRNWQKEN